uniref:Uncharacterized protein n=1 Tax=Anguilla anguilla TaxID=7936 RepID=A0A0E9S3I2_ANGAN
MQFICFKLVSIKKKISNICSLMKPFSLIEMLTFLTNVSINTLLKYLYLSFVVLYLI